MQRGTYTHRRILPRPNCPKEDTQCCVQRRSAERKTRQRGRVVQCTAQYFGPDCRGGKGSLVDMHMQGMLYRMEMHMLEMLYKIYNSPNSHVRLS